MAKLTEVVFGYQADLTLMKALKRCTKHDRLEPEGAQIELEQYSGELRFTVKLKEWDRECVVLWQPQPTKEEGVSPSVVISVNVLSADDLEQAYKALMLIKNRIS